MHGDNTDLAPTGKTATIVTYLFVAISATAWGCVAGLMFEPVLHLYERGQGRISTLVGLELVPIVMCALSIFSPFGSENTNECSSHL